MRAKMIAHRGYSKVETENTIKAFVAAGNRSYFGIESDVTMIKNKELIIFHDDDLMRMANDERKVREYTFEELQDANISNSLSYLGPTKVIKFVDYLRVCKHYNKYPIIDVKWGFSDDDLDILMQTIKEEGMYDKSIIICYTFNSCLYLKKKYPDYPIQFLLGMLANEENYQKAIDNHMDIDLRSDLLTEELVQRFHKHQLKVNVWVVDNKENAQKFDDWGVDFITTNILE